MCPGHAARHFSRHLRPLGDPHLACPSHSEPLSPAVDQLEPSRIGGREEPLLGLWSTQLFLVKPDSCLSQLSTLQKGKQRL